VIIELRGSMRYKIKVKTLDGNLLTYHISEYKIVEGDYVEFTDEKTGKLKKFHSSNVEIEEEK
jgi:hypothetical protein